MPRDLGALIVGAGPAGSVTALVLARAGVRVRIIDRERFPRPKLCGDTLNPGSLSILDALDAASDCVGARRLGSAVRGASRPILGMTVTGPGGVRVTADYPDDLRGAAITRHDLDVMLLEAAVAAGASFEEGVRAGALEWGNDRVTGVRVASRARMAVLPAGVVVAADGRASKLASAARLSSLPVRPRRWAFGAYFSGVAGMEPRGEMHVRRDGYIGVAPLPGGVTNLCVVRELGDLRVRRQDGQNTVDEAIRSESVLRERFTEAKQVSPVVSLGPLAVNSRGAGVPGLLLAGDAAGFIDPMTGDGLRFALRGGILAAEAVLDELSSGQPAHTCLQSARAREFARKWRFNRALRVVSASPAVVTLAARMSTIMQLPVRMLIGTAGDVGLARRGARRPMPFHAGLDRVVSVDDRG